MADPYSVYVRTFGKVTTGGRLEEGDFVIPGQMGPDPYHPLEVTVAIAIAAQDVKTSHMLRARADLEQEVAGLLGRPTK